jgi:ABC-type phosphate/phosphonate transport system substrate-binding protein
MKIANQRQIENLIEIRSQGIKALKELSQRLDDQTSVLNCNGVTELEAKELKALFSCIRKKWLDSQEFSNFIDIDTLESSSNLSRDLIVYADKEVVRRDSSWLKKNKPVVISIAVATATTIIGLSILAWLLQKPPILISQVVTNSPNISTLETNRLTIGILGDQKKFTELKLYLQQKFGDRVQVQIEGNGETSYQMAKDKIASKDWDIVFTTSPMISIAAQDNHYTWAAKMFADKPLFYQSVIFVRADSQIRSIKDIKPQTVIALGDFSSASSFYMPSYTLYGKKLTVDRGHRGKEIVKMVKSGKADVGAVGYPERINDNDLEFRIIDKSRNIPGSGVYLSPKLSSQDRELLKYALLKDLQAVTASKQANYTSGEEPDYSQFKQITNRVQSMLTCVDWSQKQISFYCPEKETGIIGKVISALPSSTDSNQAHLELRISDRKTYPVIIPVPLINQIPGGGSLLNLKNKQIRLIDVQTNKDSNGKLNIKIDRASQIKILE